MQEDVFTPFVNRAVATLQPDETVIGLAAGGSWASGEMDAFSDIDLVLVTDRRVAPAADRMKAYADRLGDVLSYFTGEHVGEPRLLITLYANPLLHVDIKFLTLDEFRERVENPVVLYEQDGRLSAVIGQSEARFPLPDYQWIEDRFWVWIHYGTLKIGRGEYLEALDFLGFLRMVVLGPLLHVRRGNLPRGVRKVEMLLPEADLHQLHQTLAQPEKTSLLDAIEAAATLYADLRNTLFPHPERWRSAAQTAAMIYLQGLREWRDEG